MRTLRFASPFLALLAACGLDTPKQYLVPDLRVVAVRSTGVPTGHADVDMDADGSVTLEALVLNPMARTYTLSWYGCLPAPGGSACEDPDVLRDPASLPATEGVFPIGTGNPVTLDLSPYAPDLALAKALLIAKAQAIAAGTAEPRDAYRLYVELPVLAVAQDGDLFAFALKRVRIVPTTGFPPGFEVKYLPNANPVLLEPLYTDPAEEDDACTGGTPVAAALPPGEVSLCARPETGAREEYKQWDETAPGEVLVEEDLAWQWYVTGGEIAEAGFSGNAASNPIDFTPPAGSFTVWTILRDGRGGTDWIETPLVSP